MEGHRLKGCMPQPAMQTPGAPGTRGLIQQNRSLLRHARLRKRALSVPMAGALPHNTAAFNTFVCPLHRNPTFCCNAGAVCAPPRAHAYSCTVCQHDCRCGSRACACTPDAPRCLPPAHLQASGQHSGCVQRACVVPWVESCLQRLHASPAGAGCPT